MGSNRFKIFNEQHIEIERHGKTSKHSMQFLHNALLNNLEKRSTIKRNALKNRLNHIHFKDRHVFILFKCNKSWENILERLYPKECVDDLLTCRWAGKTTNLIEIACAEDLYLLIDDGLEMVIVPVTIREIDEQILTFKLPDKSYYAGRRKARRYACRDIKAEVIHDGLTVQGELLDFSRIGFRIKLNPDSPIPLEWLNFQKSIAIYLRSHNGIIYSGESLIIRRQAGLVDMQLVVTPVNVEFTRYKRKDIRNPRQLLKPSPVMIFNHPILKKKVQIEAIDISTAGFSVNESTDEATLIPGMIIKGLTLCFAGSLCIQCDVQVIYRLETEGKSSRFGIAILDLDTNAYNDLNRIITKSVDPNAFFASEIDMDALWEFFFEAGFIYPRKNKHIRAYRQEFREIYTKLYNGKPEIAKHFISQKNGRIYGHISMIRAYERSWLIHHHVARPAALRAGFQVLRQITHYLNGMLRFPSTKTDYLMAYFRPENKFPDRVFGGFSRSLSNPRGCSMDLFAYLSHTTQLPKTRLSEEWRLREISPSDRLRLNQFYDQRSGGLLLRAMNLGRKNSGEGNLEKIYRQQGFFRRLKIYSFSYRDDLAAVMVENHSDPGLNLSELINSIIIFIVRPSDLPWNVLSIGIGHLSRSYRVQSVPLMIYPCDYVAREKIPYENKYQSWVIDVRYEDDWMKYMQKTFKAVY